MVYPTEVLGSVCDSFAISKVEVKTRLLTYEELFADNNNDEVTRIVESSLLEITHD